MAKRFNLTLRAKQDLRNIWNYTFAAWGERQADEYIAGLYSQLTSLAENPRMGKHRPDIYQGYYFFPCRSHLIFYLLRDEEIDIIGIPHKDMDTLNHFDSEYFNPLGF